MKKLCFLVLLLTVSVMVSFAGNFITELENSIERAHKGSKIEYILHFQNGNKKIITASDFKSGNLVSYKDRPCILNYSKDVEIQKVI